MSSLFLRIYVSTMAFLVIAFFIISFLANTFYPMDSLISNSSLIQKQVNQYLKDVPKNKWQEATQVFNGFAVDYDVTLINKDDLSDSEFKQLSVSKTGVIKGDNRIGNVTMLYTLPDKQTFLRINEGKGQNMTFFDWLDLFLPLLLFFVTLAFGLYLLVRKLTQPIEHLNQVAQQLGKGHLEVRAKQGLPKPLNKLANGFNSMAKQLNETIQEQQILIGAIPHELRSPLARIRFALDMTRQNETCNDYREDIEKLDTFVDQMQTTIDEILELNRLQNQSLTKTTNIPLCPIIETLSKQLNNDTAKLKFDIDCDQSQTISANPALIKRAINNLISNAQRHAMSTISIKVYNNKQHTVLQVDDDGNGIETDKLKAVFTPFSTVNKSRNRKSGGIGLGLAIVALIMKKHGGSVSASRSDLGGARFQLFFTESKDLNNDSL